MANIKYRGNTTTPATPGSTTAANTPLTDAEIDGNFKSLNDDLATKAPLSSPTLTGTPTAPTATVGTNTTQLATTAHVFAERSSTSGLSNKTINSSSVGVTTPGVGNFTTLTANQGIQSDSGFMRSSGSSVPVAGAGVEILYGASGANIGTIVSYDRTGAVHRELRIDGSILKWNISGAKRAELTAAGLSVVNAVSSESDGVYAYTNKSAQAGMFAKMRHDGDSGGTLFISVNNSTDRTFNWYGGATEGTATKYMSLSGVGLLLGTPTYIAQSILTLASTTQGFLPPRMTTTQKNAIANYAGLVVFDTTLGKLSINDGTGWGSAGGGASGGGGNSVFYENDQIISSDYTITSGKNAMTAGPITINTGVTVTIPTGSTWSIV